MLGKLHYYSVKPLTSNSIRLAILRPCHRFLSSNTELLVYEGRFANKIKYLRRFSLGTAIISTMLLPAAFTVSSSLPVVAQVTMVSTVLITSLSSTAMINLITRPYITQLYEIRPHDNSSSEERLFRATRLNLFGNPQHTTFSLQDITKSVSHPFASFKTQKGNVNFFVNGSDIEDSNLRTLMSKE